MAPFDRLHTSFYWRSVVTMALSWIISEIKRHLEDRLFHTVLLITNSSYVINCLIFLSYLLHVDFIFSHYFFTILYNQTIASIPNKPFYLEILVKNRDFFIPVHYTPPCLGNSRRNIAITFGIGKLERCGWWKSLMILYRFWHNTRTRTWQTDGRTNRQTPYNSKGCADACDKKKFK